MKKTLYALLGVEHTASAAQLSAAYAAKLADGAADDSLQHMALKEAWAILGDPQRRARYDASLRDLEEQALAVHRAVELPQTNNRLKIVLILGAVLVVGWLLLKPHKTPRVPDKPLEPISAASSPLEAVATEAVSPAPMQSKSPETLFASASPSIVRINVAGPQGEAVAMGSGVVIERGTVITNCHVTRAGPRLSIKHGSTQYDATVSVADEKHDLCKLSVSGLAAPPVLIGSVAQLKVGQKVYAIGSPQGLDLTMSDGMVSSLREGPEGTLVQTTAPISPGSSGGGLFNEFGQLVGIITFQFTGGQNLNFAIPADWIRSISDSSLGSAQASPQRPSNPAAAVILGKWSCTGPSGAIELELSFVDQTVVNGSLEGRYFGGSYSLAKKSLRLGSNSFSIEDLSSTLLVLYASTGSRLNCLR